MDLGAVPLGGLAKAVAAGTYHSVVLLVDGSVRTFGYGANGMLGYGSTTNVGNKATTLPSAQGGVGLGGEAVAVAAGTSHTVVAMADGKVFAFGKGGGQLGYGSTDDIGDTTDTLPLTVGPVSLGGNAVAVAAGTYHSLVLLDNGSVLAFGYGTYGRLGYGDTLTVGDTSQTLPSMQGPVSLGGNAVAVAAGEEHSVVLLEDGTIRAFGNGGSGRLGYGDTSNVGDTSGTVPSEQGPVSLGGNAVAVAAGDYHCVVMLEDGTARAFGQGASGRLGYGETTDVGDTPETVPSEKGPVPLLAPSPTPSPSPSPSPTPSASQTATPTASASATPTPSPTPSASSSVTASPTPTASSSVTASPTPTASSSVTASPTPTASSSVSASATSTASPSASPTASGAATGSIGNNGDDTQPADGGGVSAFVVIGAVAGAALLLGGAAWAMKRVGLASWTGGSAPSAAEPASSGAAVVQQTGSGEASAVGGASGLSSIGVQAPASGGRV